MTTSQNLSNLGQLFSNSAIGFRNRIINGDMRIWQRGSSITASTSLGATVYTADRWFVSQLTAQSSCTVTQQSTGLNGSSVWGVRVQKASSSSGSSTNILGQIIEYTNMWDLWGQSVTLSFKAKCGANYSATGNALIARIATNTIADQSSSGLVNGTWTNYYNVDNTFTLTTTYQTFKCTVPIGSGTGNIGLMFLSNTSGTAGANDWFEITDVQIESGTIASSFERRPIGLETTLCQRYFLRYAAGVFIGPASLTNTSNAYCTFLGTEKMRASPTITNNGTPKFYSAGSSTNWTGYGSTYWSPGSCFHALIGFAVGSGTAGSSGHFYSETATVDVSAEL